MLTRTLLGFSILVCAASLPANDVVDLKITVTGVTGGEGQVVVSLFDEEKNWLDRPLATVDEQVLTGDSVDVHFPGLNVGSYAVSVFYDQDSDGELDTGIFRIPKEPVGFSNNARGKFGPAKWPQTSFRLEHDLEIEIQVNNIRD